MDCPDDLASLSAAERREHVATCDVCALEDDFARSESTPDSARVQAIASRASEEFRAPRRRRGRVWVGLAAAAALVVGSAAAATWFQHRAPITTPAIVEAPPPAAPAETSAPTAVETPVNVTASIANPAPAPPLIVESASELFAEANRARREGDRATAKAKYLLLERLHPKSPEAITSHASLGLLLLDQENDATAALAQFDAYLADKSHTGLREQCIVGRARALGKLGRTDEERATWQMLLREYPSSLSAGMAEDRLAH